MLAHKGGYSVVRRFLNLDLFRKSYHFYDEWALKVGGEWALKVGGARKIEEALL